MPPVPSVKRFVWLLFAGLIGMSLAAGCGRLADRGGVPGDVAAEARDYPVELAKARDLRLPLRLADLARPMPPAAQNAAPIYLNLGHLLRAYPLSSRELALEGLSTEPMPAPKSLAAASDALAHRARYLAMVHQAAAMPVCVFPHNWATGDPQSLLFPEMATLREGAMLLSGQSVLMAIDGNPLGAAQNEALGFRMARQAQGERLLVGFDVACSIDSITCTTLWKILIISHGDPKVAQAVQAAIATSWPAPDLAAALKNETAFQQATVDSARAAGPRSLADVGARAVVSEWRLSSYKAGSPAWKALMDANAAALLRETRDCLAVADAPYPVAIQRMKGIVADSLTPQPSRLLAGALLPDLAHFAVLRAQDQARARVTWAGAGVLVWRAEHGAFPKSLDQALPAMPQDPFDGKPLRFRSQGAGFVIYSVGPLLSFAGGSLQSAPPARESLFVYPLPAYDLPAKPAPAPNA